MRALRTTNVARRLMRSRSRSSHHQSQAICRLADAFTLIEIMVVVGIMGIIVAMGIPSIYKVLKKEGMRKATSDVVDVCSYARAQAILHGSPVEVTFYPLEGRLQAGGGGGGKAGSAQRGSSSSAQIPDDIAIEMLDINLSEYKESEWARVKFYPNGTSDEMTLILRSPKNVWKKVTLEVTTGLASVDDVVR